MTARLPEVGHLVETQQEEKQKEGGFWLGVQGQGAAGQGEAEVADKLEQPGGCCPEYESQLLAQGGTLVIWGERMLGWKIQFPKKSWRGAESHWSVHLLRDRVSRAL